MLENINTLIDYIGKDYMFNIVVFIIGLFISFYLYFKTFYRMVYSTGRVCQNCHTIHDWQNEQTEFVSRVLIYNNGRKTLTKSDVKKLSIKSSKEIFSVRLLEDIKNIKLKVKKKKIDVELDNLDSAKYFVVELKHKGRIKITGRISETGKILATEPLYWIIINVVAVLYCVVILFYEALTNLSTDNPNTTSAAINFALVFGTIILLRLIHAMLFIPDNISSKYLDSTNKLNSEFLNKF